MGDRLECLRHEAVIRCHDNDDDVRDIGAAGAHGGEGGVAGCVEEGDFLAIALDAVGADVLGDAARFACRNTGLANGIEKGGFAMVDMAHESNDRGAKLKLVDLGGLGSFGNLDLRFDLVMTL